MPDTFIPISEQSDLIAEIGDHVIDAACREARSWVDIVGDRAQVVAVNLAPRQLLDVHLADRIADHLAHHEIDASRMAVEITEGALMQDSAIAARRLEALTKLGLELALDDFGTGHSSLAHLQDLPIDTLKIDRAFVERIEERTGSSLVRAMIQLAHTLGMSVIGEGVETEKQQAALVGLGCEQAQGYLFARPMDSAAATMLVRTQFTEHGRDRRTSSVRSIGSDQSSLSQ